MTIVHLNDVYEIVPVDGGKSGGLARMATVVKQLKSTRSPLLVTLGGDYLLEVSVERDQERSARARLHGVKASARR